MDIFKCKTCIENQRVIQYYQRRLMAEMKDYKEKTEQIIKENYRLKEKLIEQGLYP